MKHTLINRTLRRSLLLAAAFALAAFTGAQAAPVYTDLHDFANTPDGSLPVAGVSFDANDNIYGTTLNGGATGLGILFKIGTDGAETIVHDFGTAGDGQHPESQPTIDQSTGDIYGTTTGGGAHGYGTIWKLAGDGTYTVLYSLDGFNDGAGPVAPMLRDRMGNLYGTALQSVGKSGGTVFKFSSDGVFTVLHAFTGPDGLAPEGTIVRDRAGNLYGTTFFGGDNNSGVVYKVAPDGTFTKLYSFTGGADGLFPVGGVDKDKAGNLYGTTFFGGAGAGNVWRLAADGTFTSLYSFCTGDCSDGAYPEGDVLLVGKYLYGTTYNGGTNDGGVIWKLALDGTETVLHRFTGPEGLNPAAGQLTSHNGGLYGTTPSGGASGNGVVFSLGKR